LIDAIKVQAGANEDWRQAHKEAASAARFSAYAAEAEALVSSADSAAQARGENLKAYLLPNLQLPAAPLATDPVYALPSGTYDIARHIEDLQAGSDLATLDPEASFARVRAALVGRRQRPVGHQPVLAGGGTDHPWAPPGAHLRRRPAFFGAGGS